MTIASKCLEGKTGQEVVVSNTAPHTVLILLNFHFCQCLLLGVYCSQ